MGRCRSGATSRAARPTAAPADWSRRSSAPMSDLPDAVWVCAPPPTRTRCRWRARPPVFSINLEPSRGSSTRPSPPLRSAWFPPFGCAWSRSTARALACYVEDRAVLRGLVHRMAMGPSRRRDRPAGRAWGAECAGAVGRTAGREELMALGAFATLTAELVRTGVELVSRDLEMAQLRQALTSRVEQAKGVLAATQEVTPDEGFQQLRTRARSSSRKLADLAREVVAQEAQRERVAALAM